MRLVYKALCVALVAMPLASMAADESNSCDNVNWGKDVLEKFPNAEKGCHGVTMKTGEASALKPPTRPSRASTV